nr:hypothetical protein KPHV_36500 [Kitasatospora purpeofusca]
MTHQGERAVGDKATGALLGLAIGDALGKVTEFSEVELIAWQWPDWRRLPLPEDPVAAVRRAAYSSGDSDSIACLAGAFAGAHAGADAWPADWVERIEHRDELLEFGALWD